MTDDFDPSPRASKRLRTTTHHEARSISEAAGTSTPKSRKSVHQSSTQKASHGRRTSGGQMNGFLGEGQESDNIDDVEVVIQSEESMQPRSSGRERKKPRRYSLSPEPARPLPATKAAPKANESTKKQKTANPKSILTPSKKHKSVTRKSVAFDSSEKAIEVQFGFKDVDSSKKVKPTVVEAPETPTKRKGKSTRSVTAEIRREPNNIEYHQDVDGDDDLMLDQILEAQQWNIDTSSNTLDLSALSLDADPTMLGIKNEVLSRLLSLSSHSSTLVPVHLQSQYESIHNLLTATITTGESNSLLVLGSRGSGKTHILNIALKKMREKYANDYHLVHLDGVFQTDDKLALREIWRQLGREMRIDEEQAESTGSYADTMASLLSLLSHPDEYLDASSDEMYLDQMPSSTLSKSIVVVIDEFDLFTTHPRQTLLYNLFDIAQSRKAPIAVIGCSTRMDVVECLEKRVKSRFSHRWVHLPNAKSLDGFEDIVRNALLANEEVDCSGKKLSMKDSEARKRWNQHVRSISIQDSVKRVFYATKSVPDLFTMLYLSVASLQLPTPKEGKTSLWGDTPASTAPQLNDILVSLPTLQLSLLVAASRLDTIHNLAALNFNLVYNHYTELIARTKLRQTASGAVAVGAGLRQWTLEMAGQAWEDLGEWNLIVPALGGSGMTGRDVASTNIAGGEGANVRMWKVDVTLDELIWALRKKAEAGGTAAGAVEVLDKWCREI